MFRKSLAIFGTSKDMANEELSITTFSTIQHCCMVAACVRPNLLIAHGLQESKRMLPLTTFFASTDCCAVADVFGVVQ